MFKKYALIVAIALITVATTYTASFVAHATTDNDNTIGEIPVAIEPVPSVIHGDDVITGDQCVSILDYTDGQGNMTADGQLTLADAVVFTQRFMAAMPFAAAYDASVDSNQNQVNDISDYFCAQSYYGNAGPISCPLNCETPKGRDVNTGISCNSPLDYNDTQGNHVADGQLTLSDAMEFQKRYDAATSNNTYDITVDFNYDGQVGLADAVCATPFYGNAGPYTCKLDCAPVQACINPIDYNADQKIDLNDAVTFTGHYSTGNLLADLNKNSSVDYGDYLCSLDQIASATYQCPMQCAPVCGDKTVQQRLGEQCDDGNNVENDGCSSTCKIENVCSADLADFNDDGKVTLADAVLFTPFYLNSQTEADIDANGETKLHDYTCMNQLLNTAPVVQDEPLPVGIPVVLEVAPSIGGGSGTGSRYNLDLPASPEVAQDIVAPAATGYIVGPLKLSPENTPVKPTITKNTVKVKTTKIKSGSQVAVLSAPAIKTIKPVINTSPKVEKAEPKASFIGYVGKVIKSLFVW